MSVTAVNAGSNRHPRRGWKSAATWIGAAIVGVSESADTTVARAASIRFASSSASTRAVLNTFDLSFKWT